MKSEDVALYLQSNPQFFEEHAELISRMVIPHPHGGRTISITERQMLALVRYRLEHADYLHDSAYGAQLLDCFRQLQETYPMGFTRFHLPWVLAWYKANRQYRQACRLLEEFPAK